MLVSCVMLGFSAYRLSGAEEAATGDESEVKSNVILVVSSVQLVINVLCISIFHYLIKAEHGEDHGGLFSNLGNEVSNNN